MSGFNWVDYIFLGIFFFSIFAGFARGFVREMISLVALVAAFIIASTFASSLSQSLTHLSAVQGVVSQAQSLGNTAAQSVSYVAIGISFTILFVGTLIAGSIIGYILNIAFQSGILGFGNRVLGALFGFCRGFIISLVIIFVVQLTSMGDQPTWHQSQIVNAFQSPVQWLGNMVSPALSNLKARFGQTMQDVNSTIQQGVSSYKGFGS